MKPGQRPPCIPVYSPANPSDLLAARSALEAAGIPHLVENEHYGALSGVGLAYVGDAALRILVPGDRAGEARTLLAGIVVVKLTSDR